MADPISAKMDMTGWTDSLTQLQGPLRVKLARSMAVAGGEVLRNEAKLLAPHGPTGKLRASIYLAYKDKKSNDQVVQYSVSWNAKVAPHGHLVEFGHWQPYKVIRAADGTWFTDVTQKLPAPKYVAAHPFLRPAFDMAGNRAKAAMIERGRKRLPELLKGDA